MPGDASQQPSLSAVVAEILAREQPQVVQTAASRAAAAYGEAVEGVLFYGSGLRDGEAAGKILDFYILVSDYRAAFSKRWLAAASRVLPPSVFFAESRLEDGTRLASKINVIGLADFDRLARGAGPGVAVWARFAQPSALVYSRDAASRETIVEAVAAAVRTMLARSLPLCPAGADARAVWTTALGLTYGAELRAEPPGKAEELYTASAESFDRLFAAALAELGMATRRSETGRLDLGESPSPRARRQARWAWRMRRIAGKLGSGTRLVKAAFTFDGGIDYLAWKIERHSGVRIEPTPWQRRHPILAGLYLFLRLRRRGAFR